MIIAGILLTIAVVMFFVLLYVVVRPLWWIGTGEDVMNRPVPLMIRDLFYI